MADGALAPRLVTLAVCVCTLGAPIVVRAAEPGRRPVRFDVFEDRSGSLTIDDVTAPGVAFRPSEGLAPNFGLSDSAWWLRFDLAPLVGSPSRDHVLAVGWALVDEATLYAPRGDGTWDVREGGRMRMPSERDLQYRHPVFGVNPASATAGPYYLRLEGRETLIAPLELFSAAGFEAKRRTENVLLGAFFGVLVMMATFGVVAYGLLREPMFLWYALMVGGFALWQASSEGLFATYVWPANRFLIDRAIHLFGLLFGGGAIYFTRTYLATPERLPRLDRVIVPWTLGAFFGVAGWALLSPGGLQVVGEVSITVIGATWAVAVSLISFRQGYRPANYYILAWFIGCIAAVAQGLRALGWVPSNAFTDFGLQVSVLFTFVTLSLGIVDRMLGMRLDLERSVEDIRRLEREDAAKRTFLATASHDLRQPLHAVGLLLGALRDGLSDERSVGLLEKVQSATTEMGDMFNALLDISRLDAGLVQPKPTAVPLGPLLDRLGDEFAVQARSKGLVLTHRSVDATVQSDPILLSRILRNLLTNALRYTDEGEIRLLAAASDAEVAITVSDTGRGIPEEARERVFEPFRRLRPETHAGEALGLGLAIVHRLASLLGHSIELRSEPGQGTAFVLRLPRLAEQAAAAPDPELVASSTATFQRVLVVDDDPDVRAGMQAQLESWGYVVETVGSRAEALSVVETVAPDVVFADYQLAADDTGVEVIAEVRRRLGRDVPALVVSGDTSPELAEAVRVHGLLLLTKPVQPSRLRMALDYAKRRAARSEE